LGGFVARHNGILVPVAVALAAKLAVLGLTYLLLNGPDAFLHDLASKWDGEHYLCIARQGYVPPSFYHNAGQDFPQVCNSIHFGSLFPLAINLFGGGDPGALLASNLASLAAVAVVAWHWGRRPALFLALFPSWLVFGSVGYSESLYVLLAALALAFLERPRRQVAAGAASALAMATRYLGGPPLLLASLPWGAWRAPRRYLALFLVAVSGLAFVLGFWWYTGRIEGYVFAQRSWGGSIGWPWDHFDWLLHGWFTTEGGTIAQGNLGPIDYAVRDLLFCVPVVWGLTVVFRRPASRPSAVYSLTIFAIALFTSGLPAAGLPRHILGAFPAIAALGDRLRERAAWLAYATLGVVGGTYGLVHHLRSFWA
jgi:hypothetical protein